MFTAYNLLIACCISLGFSYFKKIFEIFHGLLKVNFINLQAVTYPIASMMVLRADSVAISIQIHPETHPTLELAG